MTFNRAAALKRERDDVVSVCSAFTEDEWSTASRCDGWTVKDVVSHMGAACHGTFTPWVVKLMFTGDLEAGNDADVEKRRDRISSQVFKEYEKWSARFCAAQRPLTHAPLGGIPVRLGEFGTYPAKLLASAITFDTQLHLRFDIGTALGLTFAPLDAERIAVAMEWMMAGLPNMSGGRLGWVDRPIELQLAGDGGGSWYVVPGRGDKPVVTQKPADDVAATIEGVAADFAVWSTRREPWRAHDVKIHGDEAYATRFLDDFQVV